MAAALESLAPRPHSVARQILALSASCSPATASNSAYAPLSPSGSGGASPDEAGQTLADLLPAEDASLDAEPLPRRRRQRSLYALLAALPAAAAVAWLGSSGRWLWSRQASGRHSDDLRPEMAVEVSVLAARQVIATPRLLPSKGTSPWVPKKCDAPASHPRCPEMEANIDFTFADEGTMWTRSVRHVKGPEKCCAMCQGTKECKAWSWVKNAGPFKNWYVCFLKGSTPSGRKPMNGVISGTPPSRQPAKVQEKVTGPEGVSLYCFSLMRPDSGEVDLVLAQEAQGASIFACNECMVYSNKVLQIGHTLTTSVVNSDLKCTSGGDFGKALNSWIFIEVWRKLIEEGRYYHHDWTVKVDPDAVFFPARLQIILQDHSGAGYVNNCREGMHGAIEVLSRKAVGALAWDYRASPNKTFPRNCVAAQELSRWGEDMFLDKCLRDTLSVNRSYDARLMCEGACGCPDWYWCMNGTTRAAFHPFKAADAYKNCLANALAGGAQPMPPAPQPCAKALRQCGGKGWRGPTCCEDGYSCRQNNTWYSQCEALCAGPLEQCGGKEWKGVTCCREEYTCEKKDKWYSQCRPPWAPDFGPSESEQASDRQDVHEVKPSSCAEAEKQCGGRQFTGATCCQNGYTCWRKDEWYSQCKRIDSPEVKQSAGNNDRNCAGSGEQCGGIGYDGPRCCSSGYSCTEKNHWYSECSAGSS
uniref:CBM1 domain-containing protein n=1 Tax=Alexandrium monilatum TaxID=311494 RepID=A0A7S4W2U4_9DINO|mmetsp:Transcript_88303/g.279377  ORF Transcript_88303/g.279377 Transcript_88303/m.279377 type:complete len:700 (+) Transcript_88303:53-2152(+)